MCYVFVPTCIQYHVKVPPCVKKFDVYIGSIGGYNAKGKIRKCSVK